MSAFGIIELTRQRMRPSLVSAGFLRCPRCRGSGIVRSMESEAIEILRTLSAATAHENIKKIEIVAEPDFACYIQNQKRAAIARLESETGRQILINADKNRSGSNFDAVCYDERGGVVKL